MSFGEMFLSGLSAVFSGGHFLMVLLAIVLGCAALALAGLGLVVEQRKEPQKIHKVPENTVKKAVCGRKVG